MRLFNAICRLPGRIANAQPTIDGEGLMAYAPIAFIGTAACVFFADYGWKLIAEGQVWQPLGIFVGIGAFALVMLVVPFVYQPSTDMAPFETDPEPSSETDLDGDI